MTYKTEQEHFLITADGRKKTASHWCRVGDKVTKEFFHATGPKHNKFHIMHLERSDGS